MGMLNEKRGIKDELDDIDKYLNKNELDIENELSNLNDDYKLLNELKNDDINDVDLADHLDNDDKININEIYKKVEIDQDEAKEIFNNMIKDLEVDIEEKENHNEQMNIDREGLSDI